MDKGQSATMLPGVLPAETLPSPAMARPSRPGPPLIQQKVAAPAEPVSFDPHSMPRPWTARVIGPDKGNGLARDRSLLAEALGAAGWDVAVFDGPTPSAVATVMLQIHLEVPAEHLLGAARQNVLVAHPEWWRSEWAAVLSELQVWAKTADAARIFRDLGARVERVGWRSLDRLDPSVPRRRAFLHVAGQSPHKGTEALIRAWRPEWPHLTVVAAPRPAGERPNLTTLGRISEEQLRQLQNEHCFHLYPARYEGYGHAEWEGLSCGAVVFATDGPPFDEHPEVFRLLPAVPGERTNLITWHEVPPASLAEAVAWARDLSDEDLAAHGARSRAAWERARAAFQARIEAVLADFAPRPLITLHSPHARCGIAEYGRQLDQALVTRGAAPLGLPLSTEAETLLPACGPGTTILLHFEPSLLREDQARLLFEARQRGAHIVFCCHFFSPALLPVWGDLVDRFVLHRPYGLAHDKLTEIPLGCPEYEPSENRAALRARLGLPPDRLVVTTLGFLSPWKRLPATLDALLHRLPPAAFLQVLTPPPFCGDTEGEAARVAAVLSRHGATLDRVLFSTDFRTETELLDRVHASDLGFLFHGQDTGSVSAATKSFVSARTPLVTTGSTHASDLREGVVRVFSFDAEAFAAEVVRVAGEDTLLATLRDGMEREYGRLRMTTVAQQYLDLIGGLL